MGKKANSFQLETLWVSILQSKNYNGFDAGQGGSEDYGTFPCK